jgi:hypothetical protein
MRAILVRGTVDHSYGRWNGPVDPKSGQFVYIPIPEKQGTMFLPDMALSYKRVIPAMDKEPSDAESGKPTLIRGRSRITV